MLGGPEKGCITEGPGNAETEASMASIPQAAPLKQEENSRPNSAANLLHRFHGSWELSAYYGFITCFPGWLGDVCIVILAGFIFIQSTRSVPYPFTQTDCKLVVIILLLLKDFKYCTIPAWWRMPEIPALGG